MGLAGLASGPQSAPQQETQPAPQDKPNPDEVNTFYAGTVAEWTPQLIRVSRTVLGKTESRRFVITPDTKIEGKLRVRVRVTVRYSSDEDVDTAVQIIVRPAQTKKK
jgi:hypothetical protein